MAFAAPVVRNQFLYTGGDLFVDVGNLNRHKRASVAEITTLLRPDLKKSKGGGEQSKDQVAHWYEAQCIHYGLPPSKDKARAKLRLLEALNTSKLEVPARLASLESDMRKEFVAAERKAKAQHKASLQGPGANEAPPVSKKRKASETIGLVDRSKDKLPAVQTADPAIKKPKKQLEPKPSSSGPEKPAERPKQYVRSSKLTHVWMENFEQGRPPLPPPKDYHVGMDGRLYSNIDGSEPPFMVGVKRKGEPVQTPKAAKSTTLEQHASGKTKPSEQKAGARKEAVVKKEPALKKGPALKKEPALKKGPALKKEPTLKKEPAFKKEAAVKKEPMVKSEPMVKKEPKVKAETKPKGEPKIKQETSPPNFPSLGLINGIYDISCPKITEEWGDTDLTLLLTLDIPLVWGAYDFGSFSGTLRIPQRPTVASGRGLPFHWRGRENGEGEMSFGDDCEGVLYFLGGGKISGHMSLYGDVEFDGQRRQGPGTPSRNAASMRDEWEEYNEDAYEEERVGRW